MVHDNGDIVGNTLR